MRQFTLLLVGTLFLLVNLAASDVVPYCSSEKITVTENIIHSMSYYDFDLVQLRDEQHIFVKTSGGFLYRSGNAGKEFVIQNPRLPLNVSKSTEVLAIVQTVNPNKLFFLGNVGNFWVTSNSGESYELHSYPYSEVSLASCTAHPSQSDWILCWGYQASCRYLSNCNQQAWVTKDLGKTWTMVAKYIWSAYWLHDPHEKLPANQWPDEAIALTYLPGHSSGEQWSAPLADYVAVTTTNFMKSHSLVLTNTPYLWVGNHARMYAIRMQKGSKYASDLYVSTNKGHSFFRTNFPAKLAEDGWTLVDDTEGAVLISDDSRHTDATTGRTFYWGDIYSSDEHNNDFSLSLAYNVRDSYSSDFARFMGIDGIYVANQYITDGGVPNKKSDIVTKISFDKAGRWRRIPAPASSKCNTQDCYLNLHGVTDTVLERFYSWHNAIGLMIGTGNVGSHLEPDQGSTFLTRDAGQTWTQLAPHSTVYEFGDHGGLITMVRTAETTNLIYTWDEGKSVAECQMTELAFTPINILVSNASSSQFWVYGVRKNAENKEVGVLVLVNFDSFHERTCDIEKDFEWWSPDDGGGNKCILGRRVDFWRRKQDAKCRVGKIHQRVREGEKCSCSDEDYECGYCYAYNEKKGTCDFVCDSNGPYKPGSPPPICNGVWYPKSNGWRLVHGTKCVMDGNSVNKLGPAQKCPTAGAKTRHALLITLAIFLVIVLIAGTGFVLFHQNDTVRQWVSERWNQYASADTFRLPESALDDSDNMLAGDDEDRV